MRLFGKLRTPHLRPSASPTLAPTRRNDTHVAKPTGLQPQGKYDSLIATARVYETQGRYSEALAIIDQALADTSDSTDLLVARASILYVWGRFWEARSALRRAELSGLRGVRFCEMLAWASLQTGNATEAEALMRNALAEGPPEWTLQLVLATALQAQRRWDEAYSVYEDALNLAPESIECWLNLVFCSLERGNLVAAEAQSRRAIALDAGRAMAWANLGVALYRQDQYQDALAAFARAAELEANPGEQCDSFVNRANCLRDAGRTYDAIALYEQNLASRPNLLGYGDYAITLLTAGRLAEGWNYYEFRWFQDPLLQARPRFAKPMWTGQDLRGKVILVRVEQGFGDMVQFIRYVPLLKALGATVVLQIRQGIEQLVEGFAGVDKVMYRDDPPPDFDFYIPLMSLPRVFGTDLASIPAQLPYLRADPMRVARWAQPLNTDGALKVGLVWAGNPDHKRDRHRSIPLCLLSPLWTIPKIRFFSLQKGQQAAEAETVPKEVDFVNLDSKLVDFADTAAVIDRLDLVLCVDTAVAHIAGAMGKPVWLMLPTPADFRWLERREDSPWYPTMRLFRQSRPGRWDDVVDGIKAALEQRLGDREATVQAQPIAPSPRSMLRPMPLARLAPGHKPGFSAVAEIRDGIVQYFPDEPVIGDSVSWYGEYLRPQLNLLEQMITPGATVMEVGAGVGVHALFLAAAVGSTGHVFLYEERPLMQRVLRQNLAVNRVLHTTLMKRRLGARSDADTETLDELRLQHLRLLKITADADAPGVLDGAAATLWSLRPLLFIAASGEGALGDLAIRARDYGYRCWRMETAFYSSNNFNCRENDIFSGGKALALLAIPEETDADITLEECVAL